VAPGNSDGYVTYPTFRDEVRPDESPPIEAFVTEATISA
jgi:hypothetical protein